MKKGKGLGDAQHDEGEIEEDDPERRKHLSVKKVRTLTFENKLAKARKTRKSPGTGGLKKFWPRKLLVEKV